MNEKKQYKPINFITIMWLLIIGTFIIGGGYLNRRSYLNTRLEFLNGIDDNLITIEGIFISDTIYAIKLYIDIIGWLILIILSIEFIIIAKLKDVKRR
jgi:hypothetical protein